MRKPKYKIGDRVTVVDDRPLLRGVPGVILGSSPASSLYEIEYRVSVRGIGWRVFEQCLHPPHPLEQLAEVAE